MLPPMVAGFADLVVGEPDRAARHRRHRAAERGIVEEALDRRRRAEAHARVVDATLVQFRNPRDVDQHRICTSPARPSRAHGSVSVAPAMRR